MTDGTSPDGGFLERLRNSPRTVSTIIVILIVVGAIFAFSDRGSAPTPSPTPATAATEAPTEETQPADGEEGTPAPTEEPSAAETEKLPPATPEPTPLPEAEETEAAYVEVAQRGDGVTHLARRAIHRSLEAATPDFEVTAEHKVWIEDYMKDRLGQNPLVVGEKLTTEKALVREAIEKSKELTDAQLKSLKRFSSRISAYR